MIFRRDKSTRRANQHSQQKSVDPSREKFFAFPVGQIRSTSSRRLIPKEGRIARRHERGMGCGGRDGVGAQVIAGRFTP
jgi:hypothetical protein